MSIYSWSIGHILEHEFFCLGCLGWAGSKEKKVDLSFSGQLLRVFFPTFWGQKKRIFFENIVESFHIFLVFLMILFTAEPLRFFIYISVCCWTFELSLLLNLWDYLLLLNLWIFFTAEPLRICSGLCICLLLNLWILFTAEPLKLSVCFWTFGFSLLLNLWIFFTAEHLRLCPGLCICLMLKLWERSAVNKITKNVDP